MGPGLIVLRQGLNGLCTLGGPVRAGVSAAAGPRGPLPLSPTQGSPHFLKSSLIAYVLAWFLWFSEVDKFVCLNIYFNKNMTFLSVHPFKYFFGLYVVSLTLCLFLFTQLPLSWLDSLHLTISHSLSVCLSFTLSLSKARQHTRIGSQEIRLHSDVTGCVACWLVGGWVLRQPEMAGGLAEVVRDSGDAFRSSASFSSRFCVRFWLHVGFCPGPGGLW